MNMKPHLKQEQIIIFWEKQKYKAKNIGMLLCPTNSNIPTADLVLTIFKQVTEGSIIILWSYLWLY